MSSTVPIGDGGESCRLAGVLLISPWLDLGSTPGSLEVTCNRGEKCDCDSKSDSMFYCRGTENWIIFMQDLKEVGQSRVPLPMLLNGYLITMRG